MPDKDSVINALCRFTDELRGTLKTYRDSEACKATVAPITDIADLAEKAAGILKSNGIPEVGASIAGSMHDLAVSVREKACTVSDLGYHDSLNAAAVHLMNFVLRHGPVAVAAPEGLRFQK